MRLFVNSVTGLFEVGVHIADVSFFVQPDTALDEIASNRTTSVYLVQKVRHRDTLNVLDSTFCY